MPIVRDGHSMNLFNGKIYIFGGIHDITWELDDLHIYNIKVKIKLLKKNNWLVL